MHISITYIFLIIHLVPYPCVLKQHTYIYNECPTIMYTNNRNISVGFIFAAWLISWGSGRKGGSHGNNSRLVCSSHQSCPSSFQEPFNRILGIAIGLPHCHHFPDMRIGVEDMVTIELWCKLNQFNLKFA